MSPRRPRSAVELAARQLSRDLIRTRAFPRLRARKLERMTQSPHGFLRGSSPMFYELLRERPWLEKGPAGEGVIMGDMHLENVGVYRTDGGQLVFGLNDFDDAGRGRWRHDLLRLLTSVLLSGRDFQAGAREAVSIAEHAAAGWATGAFGARGTRRTAPATIRALVEKARRRTRRQFLDARAPVGPRGQRQLVRGPRYFDLPRGLLRQAPVLLRRYLAALGPSSPLEDGSYQLVDAAFRVAGNGSLGSIRIALLVEAADHVRLFELKQAREPAIAIVEGKGATLGLPPAARLVYSARRLCSAPQKQLAPLAGGRFFGRRLMPQEDKLDLGSLRPGPELDAVARHVGAVLGAAHARAASGRHRAWKDRDLIGVVDRAVEMAGLHEAAFLAYGRLCPAG